MANGIVGLVKFAQHRMFFVGARSVVRMLQFNGKQEDVKAKPLRVTPQRRALKAFNLRCPRNGQRTKPSQASFLIYMPLSALNKRLGRR